MRRIGIASALLACVAGGVLVSGAAHLRRQVCEPERWTLADGTTFADPDAYTSPRVEGLLEEGNRVSLDYFWTDVGLDAEGTWDADGGFTWTKHPDDKLVVHKLSRRLARSRWKSAPRSVRNVAIPTAKTGRVGRPCGSTSDADGRLGCSRVRTSSGTAAIPNAC